MTFVFHQPTKCNLHLVREFYANWDPWDPDHEVKFYSRVVKFIAVDINYLLGEPEANANPLRQLIVTPPYAHIRYLLCGTRLAARWIRQRGMGLHSSFSYAQINKKGRIWG